MAYNWSTFKSAVKGLMSDGQRSDTMAVMAVSEWVKSQIALHVNKNPALSRMHMEQWVTQRNRLLGYTITLSTDLLRAEVNKFLTVDASRQGVQEFIDAQIQIAVAEFSGLSAFVEATIRQGVIEMEEYIEFYRQNQETRYTDADVDDEGEASYALLPEEARIWDAYYVKDNAPCVRMPIEQYDWQNRYDLKCGSPRMNGFQFYIAIEPNSRSFLLFPPVMEDYYLSIFWDGVKLNFADGDAVPFDEGFAEAVANYVLYKIYLRPESFNGKLAAAHEQVYRAKRRQLYIAAKERTAIRFRNDSPFPEISTTCGGACAVSDTTGEFDDDDGDVPSPAPAGCAVFGVVSNLAALKAIPSTLGSDGQPCNKYRAMPSASPHPFWYFVYGDAAGNADEVNVVRANDNGGNWYAQPLAGSG